MTATATATESLSVTDSSGRQISLLNIEPRPAIPAGPGDQDQPSPPPSRSLSNSNHQYQAALFDICRSPPPSLPGHTLSGTMQQSGWGSYLESGEPSSGSLSKRKYHCVEPGCNKSFTTSGHLARHNRIHTGEKNFPCLFPGCQSRFSRQDNMMQHYRTHMSPKSRRTHKRLSNGNSANGNDGSSIRSSSTVAAPEEARPRPRLHAHHRILSGPFGVEPPLTIDQHLSIYRRSIVAPVAAATKRFSPVCGDNDEPSFAGRSRSSSTTSSSASRTTIDLPPIHQMALSDHSLPLSTAAVAAATSSSRASAIVFLTSSPEQSHHEDAGLVREGHLPTSHQSTTTTAAVESAAKNMFYQHRPLTFSADASANVVAAPSSTTLLGPLTGETQLPVLPQATAHQNKNDQQQQDQQKEWPSSSSDGLLQLAHVVRTFG